MNRSNRREFLLRGMAAACAVALGPTALVGGCASVPRRPEGASVDRLLFDGARVMWCAPHPDDEALIGPILAKSSLAYGNPLFFLVLTHGEGGECCRPEGCQPDLATVREREMERVAELYHAELRHEHFFNAPLPVESFPKRHEIADIWMAQKDPAVVCAETIRSFRPDILFTFEPNNGFTGHPEHQLTARFAAAGVRMAADESKGLGGLPPHRVPHMYFGLNKYWPYLLVGAADPGPVTEVWDATQPCIKGWRCLDIMTRFSRAHRSQDRDMGMVRRFAWLADKAYLRRFDPFTEVLDPFEPVS